MDRTRRYPFAVAALLAAGVLARIAYVALQPECDPWFGSPVLDGAYYLQWAQDLMAGRGSGESAFYLAPGYPYFLSMLFSIAGVKMYVLFLVQHLLVGGTAVALGSVSKRIAGDVAGIGTVAAVLLYHPTLYFAGTPLGESLAIFLLAVAADLHIQRSGSAFRSMAGIALGLSILVRPSFLPVALLWCGLDLIRRRFRSALIFACMVAAILLPVLARNLLLSGHPVLVSSNAGMTLYHGNGPGAVGIYTPPERFSSRVDDQRAEATRIAAEQTGQPGIDAVEADQWWGRQAFQTRLQDPSGSLKLVFTRILLTLSSAEIGLDYHPGIDANPFRHAAPLPFALLLGLAGGGWYALQRRGGVDWGLLLLLLGLASVPLIFYVSSRYRLPLAVILSVPAGFGIDAMVRWKQQPLGPLLKTVGLVAGLAVLSWAVPGRALSDATTAGALANRGIAWKRAGRLDKAGVDLERALKLDPGSPEIWFNRGIILQASNRTAEGQKSYEAALALDAGHTEAAGNLSALLMAQGRYEEAISVLRKVLDLRPDDRVCWTNLAVALDAAGRRREALEAVEQAKRTGVALNPELVEFLRSGGK